MDRTSFYTSKLQVLRPYREQRTRQAAGDAYWHPAVILRGWQIVFQ